MRTLSLEQENSDEAIDSLDVQTDRERVLSIFRAARTPMGASQVAAQMGRTLFSIRPRVSNLSKAGLIQSVGRREIAGGTHETTYVIPIVQNGQLIFPSEGMA